MKSGCWYEPQKEFSQGALAALCHPRHSGFAQAAWHGENHRAGGTGGVIRTVAEQFANGRWGSRSSSKHEWRRWRRIAGRRRDGRPTAIADISARYHPRHQPGNAQYSIRRGEDFTAIRDGGRYVHQTMLVVGSAVPAVSVKSW